VRHPALPVLSLAALGVVYGDIGTSPLYAFQAALSPDIGVRVTEANVLGVLSLFFWSLILVVTVKYVMFVMRASNDGEGGIMALMALALRSAVSTRERKIVVILGLIGVALFAGDGVITPAISVLSAIEGTQVATPSVHRFVVPVTIVILTGLFLFERGGTQKVGRLFGPIMVIWFFTIGTLGVREIVRYPAVLRAVNPYYGFDFFLRQPWIGFVALGAVVLCITGTEALYADMGHFGRGPIAIAWLGLVLPGLVLSYFGQGAEVLRDPHTADNPFFKMVPSSLTIGLVVLSTVATVIASQAVISGAYSLMQQAVQLGYMPRMSIRHTSAAIKGQVYLPAVNWLLFVAIVIVVLAFRSSASLASAYGIAVTGTMFTTTAIAFVVCRRLWHWSVVRTALVTVPLMAIDLSFFAANALKIHHGGWLPLVLGSVVFGVMVIWSRGRARVRDQVAAEGRALEPFLGELKLHAPSNRIHGTAVFLTATPTTVPRALLSNVKHNDLLHERTIFLWVENLDVPRVAPDERVVVEHLGNGFWRLTLRTGFLDQPDVPVALRAAAVHGLHVDPDTASYFLGRDTVIPEREGRTPLWQKRVFATLHRNAGSSASFFRLPPDRVIEVGSQVVI
jgi:KUP system potassium uptake protein